MWNNQKLFRHYLEHVLNFDFDRISSCERKIEIISKKLKNKKAIKESLYKYNSIAQVQKISNLHIGEGELKNAMNIYIRFLEHKNKKINEITLAGYRAYLMKNKNLSSNIALLVGSTVENYSYWIQRVCEEECDSIKDLSKHIKRVLKEYQTGGKHDFGKTGHSSCVAALKHFKEYVVYKLYEK